MSKGSKAEIDKIEEWINAYFGPFVKSKIRMLFNVDSKLRDEVLRNSYILIYPPSTEGLGLPIFESMINEVPCLSWRFTSQREFVPRDLSI